MRYSVRKGCLNESAKSMNPSQPAQSAYAALGYFFWPLVNFLQAIGPYYLIISLVVKTGSRMSKTRTCMTFKPSYNIVPIKGARHSAHLG